MSKKVTIVKCSWAGVPYVLKEKCGWTGRSDKYQEHLDQFHDGKDYEPEKLGL